MFFQQSCRRGMQMKSQNKLSSVLFGNWVAKVLSFLTAVLIVIAVRFLNVTDRVVTIPIDVTLPETSNVIPISLIPDTIDVIISGSEEIIYLVDPASITAYADFSFVAEPGISRTPVVLVYNDDVYTEAGLTVQAKPSTVRILFEEGAPKL